MVCVVTSPLAKPSSQFSGQWRSLVWKRFHTLKNLTPGRAVNGAAAFRMYQLRDRVVYGRSTPMTFSFILWLRPQCKQLGQRVHSGARSRICCTPSQPC